MTGVAAPPEFALFQPITLRGSIARNRIVVSPMCQYSATDGFATDWHVVHLGSRAVGGAGIVFVEATAVVPEGRITPGDLGIWSDAHIESLARVARAIRENGAVPAIQLAHAGRKASCALPWDGGRQLAESAGGWTTVAPSAVPFRDDERVPVALDEAGIRDVVAAFVAAARRARAAGFEIVEIHSAHGYLLGEFLSPLSNRRSDGYGGSFQNRTRLLREVVQAVRAVWPAELPLFVRISATDWLDGGWDADQSVALARELGALGVDLVDTSSGGLSPKAKIPDGPGYQVPFASRIRNEAGIATGAVGRITRAEQAEEILASGHADLVFLAREMLRDPYWPIHAAQALGASVPWPKQYLRARE
jgi:2,4-dienoyl-CoA reductase (NADPH2)